jgi:hypothetical protein
MQQEIPGALSSSRECRRPGFVQSTIHRNTAGENSDGATDPRATQRAWNPADVIEQVDAGETPAMVPAEVLAASLGPSSFNSVSGEDM